MATLKDQAVCLSRRNYSETSQIITLFGREHGKIRALAKGSRRAKTKFSGGVDLLTAGEIMFTAPHSESNLGLLTEFELTDAFSHLRSNLTAQYAALAGAEQLAALTEDLDPHPELYQAFYDFLRQLKLPDKALATLVQFELRLLTEVGLGPMWRQCCLCGGDPTLGRQIYFSSREGGVVCRDCEGSLVEKHLISRPLQQFFARQELSSAPLPLLFQAHDLLTYHIREILGRQLPAVQQAVTVLKRQVNSLKDRKEPKD